jgi:hypothetical protein
MSDTITISVNDYAENEYLDSTMTIDTSMLSGSTITLGGAGGGGAVSGYVYTTNSTGGYGAVPNPGAWAIGSNFHPNESHIKIGDDFSIIGPGTGQSGPTKFKYKDQEIELGQLFGMFNAFKTLLKSVADDPEFCAKHPEIRDMSYGYLIEELKR